MASQLRVTALPSVASVSPLLVSSMMLGGTEAGISEERNTLHFGTFLKVPALTELVR